MKIVLYDPFSAGHHTTYMQQFVLALVGGNHQVSIFFPRVDLIKNFLSTQSNINASQVNYITIREVNEDLSRWATIRKWINCKQQISNSGIEPDHVFFCWVDNMRFKKDHFLIDKLNLWYVNNIFRWGWSGLYFHPTHLRIPLHPKAQYKHYTLDDIFKTKNCEAIAVLDEGIIPKLEKATGKKIVLFPDITDITLTNPNMPLVQEINHKAAGRKKILLVGTLQKRKGLLQVIKMAQKLAAEPYFFIIVGKLYEYTYTRVELEQIAKFVASNPQNCFLYLQTISDGNEFNAFINTSDIVYAAYFDFPHSSNVIVKAALFNKPSIVSTGGLMEELCAKYKLGIAVQPDNIGAAIAAIKSLSHFVPDKNSLSTFAGINGFEQLKASFEQIIS